MMEPTSLISDAFKLFLSEAPEFAKAWGGAVQSLAQASALDPKTRELSYLSVLAALGRTSGIPFHVVSLKKQGTTRDEIISTILVGLPAAGQVVTTALPSAIQAFDAEDG